MTVKKKSPSIMMIVNLVSQKDARGTYLSDDLPVSNYATIQIKDELLRLPGVGDVTFLGQRDYSMRAWLDPEKLATRNMTASDVVNALSEQNIQVAAGQVGQQPVPAGQNFQFTMSTLGRLARAGAIRRPSSSKTTGAGQNGQGSPSSACATWPGSNSAPSSTISPARSTAKPSVALSIYQLPGSNALEDRQGVYDKMDELKKRFPAGLDYKIVYDTTPFISESIVEVFKTLLDAIMLVAIVVLVFLQNWRAALIPLVAVPVAIVGTFAVMAAIGFSLNNLSLFGLVLAIGIVVDDAIVVVENVERWLEQGLSPARRPARPWTRSPGRSSPWPWCSARCSCPCAFISGITGQFFRQFALTIAVSTVISAFNSLTLSPALAALLLKPHGHAATRSTRLLDLALGWFFRLFNGLFDCSTPVYTRVVGMLLRVSRASCCWSTAACCT